MIESAEDQAIEEGSGVNMRPYTDFIEEVFIAPIRTAVVVDDEFPTLDEFLSDPKSASGKLHAERAKDIVAFCRARKPFPWIVDVHDGKNISVDDEKESATHFDHTDLLVLDYNLNGEQSGGDLAVSLLKRLAKNDHFNLVIIYTNSNVSMTLREIGLGLSSNKRVGDFLSRFQSDRVEEVYQRWVDEDNPVVGKLKQSLDALLFLKAVHQDEQVFSECSRLEGFAAFFEILKTQDIKFKPTDMLRLFLQLKYPEFKESMSPFDYGAVHLDESNASDGSGVNWLRVDSLFLTVINKSEVAPDQFTEKLKSAIAAWDPSPHRLIVTKMRSEIARRGVMVEKEVLQNPYLQAAWLSGLFDKHTMKRKTNIAKSVARHWDSLGGRVEPEVLRFAEEVCSHLNDNGIEFNRFHSPIYARSSDMALHVNHYVCSKNVEGHHLFTGHVLRINDGYWVCLTPACDLEPGRNVGKGLNAQLGNWKPFKAARIEPLKDARSALLNAPRGHHLFLSVDGAEPKAFSFAPDGDPSALPTLKWQQFYAENQGVFEMDRKIVKIVSSVESDGELQFRSETAEVVAQLRYEYALNLLHRLGSHLSRVGLDFIGHS